MINYEFANRIPNNISISTGEEELGIDAYAKAKLTYHPQRFLKI
jgi:hypothetical protein